jgi:hypothetical protein
MAWTNPRTWLAAETVTAALMNTHLRDNLKAIGDPFVAYTPTWTAATTNPSIGNGTLSGSVAHVGRWVRFRISITFGSTTSAGDGAWLFSAPTSLVTGVEMPAGECIIRDASPINRMGGVIYSVNSTTFGVLMHNDSKLGSATIAWATDDKCHLVGQYESSS